MSSKNKSYRDKRAEDIHNQHDMENFVDNYHNLGMATAFGYILFALDEEYSNKEIRDMIIEMINTDEILTRDTYAINNDVHMDLKRQKEEIFE